MTWCKIHKKIWNNGLAKKPSYLAVWIYLLTNASVFGNDQFIFNNKKMTLKKGQLITGAKKIAEKTGVPRATVERIIKYLKNEEQIDIQVTNKFSVITIRKWHTYQGNEEQNEEPARSTRGAREDNKEDIEVKEVKKNIYISDELKQKYSPKMLIDFLLYWEETDSKGTPRWKKEKTWETVRRLERWKRNEDQRDWERSQRRQGIKEEKKEMLPRVNTGITSLKEIIKNNYEQNTKRNH